MRRKGLVGIVFAFAKVGSQSLDLLTIDLCVGEPTHDSLENKSHLNSNVFKK